MTRKKTSKDTSILWFLVKEVLAKDPTALDEELNQVTQDKFEYELPGWLRSEARFVYSQKVKRGEIAPLGGHATLQQAQDMFNSLSAPNRAKFLDWAQFIVMQSVN